MIDSSVDSAITDLLKQGECDPRENFIGVNKTAVRKLTLKFLVLPRTWVRDRKEREKDKRKEREKKWKEERRKEN